MAGGQDILTQIDILTSVGAAGTLSDADLMRFFLSGPEGVSRASLAVLADRHGPMVQRTCRHVLGDSHDADDAFQAAFLVLVHKAGSVRRSESVAGWLHGVALRVSMRAKADADRRQIRERRGAALNLAKEEARGSPDAWPELHEEVARLPARYREPVILCYLEGLSTEAAAARIGCPRGTVLSRLSRARERLRVRLTRRGLTFPAAFLAATSAGVTSAAPPAALLNAMARVCWNDSRMGASRAASSAATTLARGMIRAMLINKLKTMGAAGGLCVGLLLGSSLTAVFTAAPRAMAQGRPVPAEPRFQIVVWVHPPGAMPATHGSYILDTQGGEVWHIVEGRKPVSLGSVIAVK
jgi:RNA polymerase sigma factor (sigma-70 family)